LLRDYPGGEDGREKMLAAVLMVHDRIVEGTATTGTSGRYARVRVAKKAAEVFEGLSLVDFRARWGCTCGGKVVG
jgi:endoribonuclease Dicer